MHPALSFKTECDNGVCGSGRSIILGGSFLRVLRVTKILRWWAWRTLALAVSAARPSFAPLAPAHGLVESEEVKKKKKKRASDQRTCEENSQGKRSI